MGRHQAIRSLTVLPAAALAVGSLVGPALALTASPQAIDPAVVSEQPHPGWALDRIDQRTLPLNHEYRSRTRGRGVRVYVIDCGAQVRNSQFGGRAVRGPNIAGGRWIDCFDDEAVGHATFVSGIIGGAVTGVAKRVQLISVRTISGGEGAPTPPPATELRRVVRAIDWVIDDAASHHKPAVVNMSLSFHGSHQRLTDAMARLEDAGITAVVAAGNDGSDSCNHTPGNIPSAITVGATTRRDQVWSGSNVGRCVDLFAPGVSVRSVLDGGGVFTYRHSGATSWATPYVTGAVALYLSEHPDAQPREVRQWIRTNATRGQLNVLTPSTVNRLLYSFPPTH